MGFSTTNYCSPFLGGVKLLLVVTFLKKMKKKQKTICTAAFFTLFRVGSFQLKERVYSSTLHLGASLLASRFDRGQSPILMPMSQGQLLYLFCSMYLVFMFSIIYYIYLISFLIASYTVQYGFICRIMYLLHVILVYIYIYIYVYTSYMKLILKMLQKNWRGCTLICRSFL